MFYLLITCIILLGIGANFKNSWQTYLKKGILSELRYPFLSIIHTFIGQKMTLFVSFLNSKIAISRTVMAFVISFRCFSLTSKRSQRQTVIENDFSIRLTEIKSTSQYVHTSYWSLRWSFLFSLSLSLYLPRCMACINMRRCTRPVTLYAPYMDVAILHEASLRSWRRMNFGFPLHHVHVFSVFLKLLFLYERFFFILFVIFIYSSLKILRKRFC